MAASPGDARSSPFDVFIRRPVLSGVLSILLTLLGAISIPGLPVAQYPELALPTVTVQATYLGASAEVVERAVTIPLEQELNGVEGMRYISSTSSNNGVARITLTFEPDRDVDLAAVDVQNRVSVASPRLPPEVNQRGIVINKAQSQLLLTFGLYSEDGRYDEKFLSNYASVFILDRLKRVRGVGEVRIFGERQYAMRLWLDPLRLAERGLTTQDVVAALREQNIQVAAGQVGSQPAPGGVYYQLPVRARSRLETPEEFADIVLKRGPDGALVRVRDVGRAELGAESYDQLLRFSGRRAVGLGIFQLATANALDVREGVLAELRQLQAEFPPGLKVEAALDTTAAVEASIQEVLRTLGEAILLVLLVIFLFLHRLRSLLIVALTLPVSLVGTFLFVRLLDFSINTLTLFGLTLATGLVVDDAIVVLENVERQRSHPGRTALEAARVGMREVGGAVLATSLVLIAVFAPVAFLPGTTGSIYRQFALTIAAAIALSTLCALTLSPALCALLLKGERRSGRLFQRFDRGLEWVRDGYGRTLNRLVRHRVWVLVAFVLSLGLTVLAWRLVPTGFIPDEDQGYLIIAVQGPEGVSLEYTREVLLEAERVVLAQPEVREVFVVGGFSLLGTGPNYGVIFVTLRPWDEREEEGQSVSSLVQRLAGPLSAAGRARVLPLQPPAIRGVGTVGGFQFIVQDRTGTASLEELAGVTARLAGAANGHPDLAAVFSTFAANTPLLDVQVDRARAKALGVSLDELYGTLQALLGGQYVNDFDFASRTYRVYVQGEATARDEPQDIPAFYVRTLAGEMRPLEGLVALRPVTSAQTINHYNLYRSTELNGRPGPGRSSGQALEAMEAVARQVLPTGFGFEWTGASLEQKRSGGQTLFLFALAVVFVFLVLAAQYESFTLPLVIILSVPVAVLGALGFQALRGLPNDVFCQVGLVMLVGLASKNAILIVEFAEQLRARGRGTAEAVVEAAQLRLRPILMTSIAFLLGVLPLVLAHGAGAAARTSLGTAVFGGMLVSSAVNLVFIPVLYVLVTTARERLRGREATMR